MIKLWKMKWAEQVACMHAELEVDVMWLRNVATG